MENALLAIRFRIFDTENHWTAMEFCVNGENILRYIYKNEDYCRTATGDLDDLMEYLEETLKFIKIDVPFPFDNEGDSAADLAHNAKQFELTDEEEFWKYHLELTDWCYAHSWLHTCVAFYISKVFFRSIGDYIEISWGDNKNRYSGDVKFMASAGCIKIPVEEYKKIIHSAIKDYHCLWGGEQ